MKKKHLKTLELIYCRPVSANISWLDIEALLLTLGAKIEERECPSHRRPHPSPMTDKGAVASLREWLNDNGVTP